MADDFFTKAAKSLASKAGMGMEQWGTNASVSTLGKKEWSPAGAEKAQAVLEGVGSFLPVIGQAIAAKDYAKAMEQNDSAGGVLAAAQFIPVLGGTAKLGSTIWKPSAYALKMMRYGNMAERGMEKAIKHGGTTSAIANLTQAVKDLF